MFWRRLKHIILILKVIKKLLIHQKFVNQNITIDVVKSHCSEEKFKELKSVVDGLSDSKASLLKSAYENKSK